MRLIEVDGSPERVAELVEALAAALDGGPPVLPVAVGAWIGMACAPEGTAVVIATSGSTGEPKLVALSAAALRASARATEARLGGPGRWLLALPAEHVAGIQVVVRALLAGAAPAVLDLRAGFRPDAFAAATAALGPGRRYTSLVPTQLGRILDGSAAAVAALRGYAAVLVGGAALDPATRDRALAAGVRVVTTYGMSETAGGCVYDGVPLDGVTVDLDADGRILLGGPMLASGYLHPDGGVQAPDSGPAEGSPSADGAASAAGGDRAGGDGGSAAGGKAAGGGRASGDGGFAAGGEAGFAGGRFRTGDLGRWRDGRLEVLGRADDVIVTGGEKVAPAAVERVLAAQPGVRAACVVGLPDAEWGQVVAAAVVWEVGTDAGSPTATGATPEPKPSAESLREAVREVLGRAAVPRRVVAVDALPLRGIGKPDRAAVARLVSTAAEAHHPAR